MQLDDSGSLRFSVFDLVDIKMVFEAVEVGAGGRFHCLGHALMIPKLKLKNSN